MLDKYQKFYKLAKSSECSIYTAFNRQIVSDVLLVKFETKLEWHDILAHKHLLFMNKSKLFMKMSEIFKHKGSFYLVFDKPCGSPLSFEYSNRKYELQTFYQIYNAFLEGVKEIQDITKDLRILPQWIFFHRNSLKLIYFSNFLNMIQQGLEHVVTHQQKPQKMQQLVEIQQNNDIIPEQYKKNLIFNLGIVAYHLLMGKKGQIIQNKQNYIKKIQFIRTNCERLIIRTTQDTKLADFISKMISNSHHQVPKFYVVCNFFQSRVKMFKGRQENKQYDFTIELQKIQLTHHKRKNETQHLKSRRLYAKEQNLTKEMKAPKRIDFTSRQKIKSDNFLMKINKNKLILPYLPPNKRHRVMNRHNLIITPTQYIKSSNPGHAKSFDFPQE